MSIGADQLDRIGVGAPSFNLRIGSVGGALRPGEDATGTLTIRSTADFSGRALTLEAGSAGAAVTQDPGAAVFAGSLIARSAQGSVLLGRADNIVGVLAGAALGATSDFEYLGFGNVTLGNVTHGTDGAAAGISAGRTVRLRSIFGAVQQTATAPITAQNLLARSDLGTVDLTASAANSVGTLAGDARAGFQREHVYVERRDGKARIAHRKLFDRERQHRHTRWKSAPTMRSRLTKPVSGSVHEPVSSVPDTSIRPLACSKVRARFR